MREFESHVPVQDFNEVANAIHLSTSLEVKSRFNSWEPKIDCAILPMIKGMIRATCIDCNDWGIPEGLMSVDEKSNKRNSIVILLGADVFFEVLHHDETRPGYYSVLQDTELGWIIAGNIPLSVPEEVPRKSFFTSIITT